MPMVSSAVDDLLLVRGVKQLSCSGKLALWQASTKMVDCCLSIGAEQSNEHPRKVGIRGSRSYRPRREVEHEETKRRASTIR